VADPAPVPDLLTIEEAALVLRIGRTAAYEQARLWRATGGRTGIPNIEVGRQYRVPRAALEAMIGRPITHIPEPRSRQQGLTEPGGREDASAPVRQLHPYGSGSLAVVGPVVTTPTSGLPTDPRTPTPPAAGVAQSPAPAV
jgi:hypothetical protein